MQAVVQGVLVKIGRHRERVYSRAGTSLEIPDVGDTLHRFEDGFQPAPLPRLAAGRTHAKAVTVLVLALQGHQGDMGAERGTGSVETVTQVGPQDARRDGLRQRVEDGP